MSRHGRCRCVALTFEPAALAQELGERLGRMVRRVPWQQANELRLDLTKPVRTAFRDFTIWPN